MKKLVWVMIVGCLFVVPELVQAQVDKMIDQFLEKGEQRGEGRIRPEDLRIVQMEFSPDPVRQGQQVSFRITIANDSRHSGRITLVVKDRDEVISEARDVNISSGENSIDFPETNYRFSREDHCFTVEADIERNRRPISLAKEFCAQRTSIGWTLGEPYHEGPGPRPAHLSRIEGSWFVNVDNTAGKLEFNWTGNAWSGRIWFNVLARWEELTDVSIDPGTGQVQFYNPLRKAQYYGTLSGDRIEGTFSHGGTGSRPWAAWRH